MKILSKVINFLVICFLFFLIASIISEFLFIPLGIAKSVGINIPIWVWLFPVIAPTTIILGYFPKSQKYSFIRKTCSWLMVFLMAVWIHFSIFKKADCISYKTKGYLSKEQLFYLRHNMDFKVGIYKNSEGFAMFYPQGDSNRKKLKTALEKINKMPPSNDPSDEFLFIQNDKN